MDKNVIDIMNQIKRQERKERFKARLRSIKKWVNDNKEALVVTVPAAAAVIGSGIKILGRRRNLHIEERNKDRRCYDARLGHYWELKRKLNNREWTEIDQRMANGERMSDILNELNVLR